MIFLTFIDYINSYEWANYKTMKSNEKENDIKSD